MLSVLMPTFNHEKWVEQAIDSVLGQVTSLKMDLIVLDDCSTDQTPNKLKTLVSRHKQIKYFRNSENMWSKGIRPIHLWPRHIKSNYVSVLEGDDYWLSRDKIERQFDQLNRFSCEKAVLSVGLSYTERYDKPGLRAMQAKDFTKECVIHPSDPWTYFHPSSWFMDSKVFLEVSRKYLYPGSNLGGDVALRVLAMNYGSIVLLPDFLSVYRFHGVGAWSSRPEWQRRELVINVWKNISAVCSGELRALCDRQLEMAQGKNSYPANGAVS